MEKEVVISFLVIFDGDILFLNKFLDSLTTNIKEISFEVIILDNALGFDNSGLSDIGHIKIVTEKERKKPQDLISEGVIQARGQFVIIHSSRDYILPAYEKLLKDYLSQLAKDDILLLPHSMETQSKVFLDRPIISGKCFLRGKLVEGFPFDFIYRQDLDDVYNAITLENKEPVFVHKDIPLCNVKSPYKVSLIVTIKNRVEHWNKSMPTLISQQGVDYELLLVDYYSEDDFSEQLEDFIHNGKKDFSPWLKQITIVRLKENKKFNSCKAKNLGVRHMRVESEIIAFSDVDTLLREDYLNYWISKIKDIKTNFVVTRAAIDRRVSTEVNYGNMFVPKNLYVNVKGHNEDIQGYGGDDDEFIHRLHNVGGVEINSVTAAEARQYSILHGQEQRTKYLEKASLSGLQDWEFLKSKELVWTDTDDWGVQPVTINTIIF
ncbi:MAG: glycosyltransferase [Candidatus Magasanikbacteria bacterium]